MSRLSLVVIALLAAGVYLVSLGWFGTKFISYAKGNPAFSLQPHETRQAVVGDTVTLEIAGSGFDKSLSVQMYLDINNQDAIVGTFPLDGNVNDMLLDEDQLFLATTNSGLQVLDISNPTSPKLICSYLPRLAVLDIEKSGDYYILSVAAQGVYIFKKTKKGTLQQVKRMYFIGAAIESRVVGNFLYVAAGTKGVQIFDLSKPEDDYPVSVVDAGGSVVGIETYRDRIYLATLSVGVQVYQIQETGKLLYIGRISDAISVRNVKRYQDKLYLLESTKVSLYQLGESQLPELLESEIIFSSADHLLLVDKKLYVSDNRSGVNQIDIGQPEHARSSGYLDVGGNPRAMAHQGKYLFIAVPGTGLKIVDPQAILPRQLSVLMATSPRVTDLLIKNQRLYVVSNRNGGLLSGNLNPESHAVVQLGDGGSNSPSIKAIYAYENLLYVTNGSNGVDVFTFDDSATPRLTARWPELQGARSLARVAQFLVLGKSGNGLALVDISDVEAPVISDSLADIYVMDVEVQNELIFVACEKSGVLIFGLTAQGRFEQIGKIVPPFPLDSFSAALDVQVRAGIAYIANGHGGLLIADVREPREAKIISSIDLPGNATALTIVGTRVYVSCQNSGVQVVDVGDLKQPQLETSITMSGLQVGMGFQVANGMIYLGNGSSGVTAIPVPQQINNFKVLSAEKLRVTLPKVSTPGRYSIQVNSKKQSAALNGVVRYQTAQNL